MYSLACYGSSFSSNNTINIVFFRSSNGIVGEYLGRIFKETKNRPLYFVNEYNGIKDNNDER